MTSPAFDIFQRLMGQVQQVREAAARDVLAGHTASGPVLLRSALVLTVAAFDTYIHEQGVRLLQAHSQIGTAEAKAVAAFLGGLSTGDVTGTSAEGLIRYRLSYKTLVSPDKVDQLLAAVGLKAEDVWLRAAIALGSRPDRLRLQTQLQYDRRNQIAHEGDWDFVALDFRSLEDAHVNDCVNGLAGLVGVLDSLL
jgi:hypothetical protein